MWSLWARPDNNKWMITFTKQTFWGFNCIIVFSKFITYSTMNDNINRDDISHDNINPDDINCDNINRDDIKRV
jgi:hypothetical protein